MGLNVGGIHVLAHDITQEAVAEHIVQHWLALGAELVDDDPLAVKPLSVDKTGDLAFCVFPVMEGDDERPWIAVHDSERYTADAALAAALATVTSATRPPSSVCSARRATSRSRRSPRRSST